MLELEHYREQRIVGSEGLHAIDLRVTSVFRREDGAWKIVHRHADPIVTARDITSAIHPG